MRYFPSLKKIEKMAIQMEIASNHYQHCNSNTNNHHQWIQNFTIQVWLWKFKHNQKMVKILMKTIRRTIKKNCLYKFPNNRIWLIKIMNKTLDTVYKKIQKWINQKCKDLRICSTVYLIRTKIKLSLKILIKIIRKSKSKKMSSNNRLFIIAQNKLKKN